MCIKPLSILNKAYKPYNIYTPKYIDVPCGHCWQCKLKRVNELSFRLLVDVLNYNSFNLFVTLTYDDEHLPYLFYKKDDEIKRLSVWNRSHVQKYFKNIRRQLQYYFGIDKDSFKYYCTCERGHNNTYVDKKGQIRVGTNRPHYHIIFILLLPSESLPVRNLPSKYLSFARLNNFGNNLSYFFRWLLHDKWFYGFVDDKGLTRDVVSAIRYVTKYVCKDLGEELFNIDISDCMYLHDPSYNTSVHDWYSSLIPSDKGFIYNGVVYCASKRFPLPVKFTSLLPRPFGSSNIGMSFVDNLDVEDLVSYLSGDKQVTLPFNKSSQLVNLPSYYFRRLCKSVLFHKSSNPYYRFYYDEFNNFHTNVLFKSVKLSDVWDNCNFHHGKLVNYYPSEVFLSDFGKSIFRFRFKNFVHDVKVSIENVISNSKFYCDMFNSYCLLPSSSRLSCDSILTSESISNAISSIEVNSVSFREVVKTINIPYYNIFSLNDPRIKNLCIIYYLIKICRYYVAHLQHLSFEKGYVNKIGSVATDNSDLFINHYI